MALNGAGFTESIVHAPQLEQGKYTYRTGMGMIPSAEFLVYFDDFTDAVTTNVPAAWDAAVIDTGATVVSDTTAGSLGATGVLLFDSDGATEGAAIYGEKSVQLTVGKKFFMEIRFQTEIANDSDVQFGLTDLTAVTNPEDLWSTVAASFATFGVLDGDATVAIHADAANSGTTSLLGTIDLQNATWHTLGLAYDGATLTGFVDGALAATWVGVLPTGVALAPFVGFRNGSAATTEGHLDYARLVIQR